MLGIEILIGIAVVGIGGGLIFSPKFRQMLRIRTGKAVDAATTAIEKEQDEYDQLVAKLPAQRTAVAKVIAAAGLAAADMRRLQDESTRVKSEYQQAKLLGASEAALDDLGTQYQHTLDAIQSKKEECTIANQAANEARETLDQTVAALKRFAAKVESDKGKAELTKALEVAADARQKAGDINSALSRAGQQSRVVDEQLEQARAANELSKGSQTEQELANLREKAAGQSGRAKLDAMLTENNDQKH
jgi:hypothetical protein